LPTARRRSALLTQRTTASEIDTLAIFIFRAKGKRTRVEGKRNRQPDCSVRSKWIIGDEERDAVAGDVPVVRAGEPHKFVGANDDRVHWNPTFETAWLE
jgi:hypothetical protein